MPSFAFTGRDGGGSPITGEVVARSQADAIRQLRSEGKFVTKLSERNEKESATVEVVPQGSSRVKTDEIIFFVNQLACMVDTGVPIADALEATIDQSPPGGYRRTIEDLIQRVQGGQELSASLAAHPKAFPPLLVHMVRASEASGTLGKMLSRVADYMANQREIRKKIRGAMIYPICMLIFAVGVTIFLLTCVLPKFTAIYAGKEAVLPWPTRVLMDTSAWMVENWLYLLGGTIASVIATVLYFRSAHGRYTADWLRLHVPLIGGMFRRACLARSLRTLGTMISSGVSVLDAVRISRDVVGNRLFARIFDDVYKRLERGDQLSHALLDAPFFPRNIWQMINAGERTGQIGPSMERISDFCESELKHSIRTVTQFIEPAMILLMGLIVGGIAVAMLLPIFKISKVLAS